MHQQLCQEHGMRNLPLYSRYSKGDVSNLTNQINPPRLKTMQNLLAWPGQRPRILHESTLNQGLAHVSAQRSRPSVPQPEHALHHRELGRRGVRAAERRPVVDRHARGDDLAPPVDSAGDEGHLQQRRQLVQVLDRRVRVNLQNSHVSKIKKGHYSAVKLQYTRSDT